MQFLTVVSRLPVAHTDLWRKQGKVTEEELLHKYNVPVPRYTSYPTVPYWHDAIDADRWDAIFKADFRERNRNEGISLYLHLPFCESLCTYCGCNKKITTRHDVEDPYITALHAEWRHYLQLMNSAPVLRELHLGGGTPTFFSPANLLALLEPILSSSKLHPDFEFSFEGHPNNTTAEHLQTLYDLGFRRVSYGVQDNDPAVQRVINRIQPFANVQAAIGIARAVGYKSVNFDLVYSLPLQTLQTMEQTIRDTIALRPDRIAFYSYAHVPWTSKGQRLYDERDLPSPAQKMAMYLLGRRLFTQAGYCDIGMDHFALPADDLCLAAQQGRLHRSFMGYTIQPTSILLGLGVSSISTTPGAFVQNDKALHSYYQQVESAGRAVTKGHFLSDEDRRFGRYILDISCKGQTTIQECDWPALQQWSMAALEQMQADGLLVMDGPKVQVAPAGRNFTRNICSAFDMYLRRNRVDEQRNVFSKAV